MFIGPQREFPGIGKVGCRTESRMVTGPASGNGDTGIFFRTLALQQNTQERYQGQPQATALGLNGVLHHSLKLRKSCRAPAAKPRLPATVRVGRNQVWVIPKCSNFDPTKFYSIMKGTRNIVSTCYSCFVLIFGVWDADNTTASEVGQQRKCEMVGRRAQYQRKKNCRRERGSHHQRGCPQ